MGDFEADAWAIVSTDLKGDVVRFRMSMHVRPVLIKMSYGGGEVGGESSLNSVA